MPLVLASSSAIRRAMLTAAGVDHDVVAADVDETAAKKRIDDPQRLARTLAGAKALSVSAARSGDWVIGSDSVVSCAGRLFDKPTDRAQAGEHLRCFSGQPMELISAVALALGGNVDWMHTGRAKFRVRDLSDAFIADYLDAEWPDVGYCVGVFRLEGRGVQLFDSIDGDHFTILGMPLLPLLGALRARGLIPS